MCDERRATVTTARFKGKQPSQDFSLTLSKIQVVMALVVHAVTILSAALGLAWWLGRVMVHQEFDKAIEQFHAVARPGIERVIDEKILEHNTEVAETYEVVRVDMIERLRALEVQAESTDKRLIRIEDKLDRLLERR